MAFGKPLDSAYLCVRGSRHACRAGAMLSRPRAVAGPCVFYLFYLLPGDGVAPGAAHRSALRAIPVPADRTRGSAQGSEVLQSRALLRTSQGWAHFSHQNRCKLHAKPFFFIIIVISLLNRMCRVSLLQSWLWLCRERGMGRGLGRLAALISRAWHQLCVNVVHRETEVWSASCCGDFPLLRSSSAACPNCSPSSEGRLGTLTQPHSCSAWCVQWAAHGSHPTSSPNCSEMDLPFHVRV